MFDIDYETKGRIVPYLNCIDSIQTAIGNIEDNNAGRSRIVDEHITRKLYKVIDDIYQVIGRELYASTITRDIDD